MRWEASFSKWCKLLMCDCAFSQRRLALKRGCEASHTFKWVKILFACTDNPWQKRKAFIYGGCTCMYLSIYLCVCGNISVCLSVCRLSMDISVSVDLCIYDLCIYVSKHINSSIWNTFTVLRIMFWSFVHVKGKPRFIVWCVGKLPISRPEKEVLLWSPWMKTEAD